MALKSEWANINARRIFKESTNYMNKLEQERLDRIEANKDSVIEEYKNKQISKDDEFDKLFSSILVGMSLVNILGINGVVEKKNIKSIILTSGTKWTKKELRELF